ncbi:MAG: replicative DNA helicase [Dactylosporangium sp.]|nr:replicative DNA helicase [Dactylosporangium sp.]NNJ61093.1 replicative DNA helicase [Dactylosporangium sp.]
MLLSKDAIADVVEILRAGDFYRPVHTLVFEAILDLYGRGEPADPITVAAALADAGTLAKAGGAPYLHTLIASVPTAANAGYYARIVAERAVLRRLVEAGTRIAQLGYGAGGGGRDVDDVVDLAQQAVYDVTEKRISEDFAILADMLQPTLDEIEAVGAQGGVMTGVPTGFTDLDRLLNGLHPGQLIIVAGRPGLGKCLAADALVTEARTGERIPIADFVRRGRSGEALTVHSLTSDWTITQVTPDDFVSNGVRQVHRLTTESGRTVRATANHPFLAATGWQPLERLRVGDRIAVAGPPPYRAATAGVPAGPAGGEVTLERITSIEAAGPADVYDLTVDATSNFVAGGIVVHNSTAAMDFARSASVRGNQASAIFSLEMSKVEIVMRLLSAEAKVPLHVLRSGQLSDDDWTKLARRMGEISEAPLFVDDTPNMTLMEIRAKARRLRQRNDLKLIVVDYLQLMTSPKRIESRQQEVADLSRGLKLLAKEVECPVIAVSQLNRGPEQRTDKRPQLSDLRESGCMTADTTLLRADTGVAISFAELLRDGCDGVTVWSLGDRGLVAAPLLDVFASGVKEVFGLTLASGRHVKASANHPFLTPSGWKPLGTLAVGDHLAVPRRVPDPVGAETDQDVVHPEPIHIGDIDDVAWDPVVSIEPLGTRPVFDATVGGTHNFIADGIIAHNSIEQDADVVILLHRDDYYDKESPRAGEADFIVAKHRNGPTDTVTVAAQLHFSRFVDMAIN